MQQEKWLEANATAQRAKDLLAGVGDDPVRQQRLQQMEHDLKMAESLELIRLQQAAEVKDGNFNRKSAAPAYTAAFDAYNLPVLELEPEETALRIAASAIAKQLRAALVDWSNVHSNPVENKKLRMCLRLADRDAWRQQVWDALDDKDRAKLARLAQAAIKYLRQAQQRHPDDFWINHQLAYYLAEMEEPQLEEAIGYYRAALALRPHSPGVHLNLGNALMGKGRLDEAIAENCEAIRLKKDYAEAHNNLGRALSKKGQLDEAIAEYRGAIRLKKNLYEAHDNLGRALSDKGQLEEAIAEFRECSRLKKDDAEAHYNLGFVLLKKSQLDEAIAEFREAIRLKKDHAEAHNNLGAALRYKDQFDAAIAEFREAIRLKKGFAEAHHNLGNALMGKGQLDAAIAEFREAIRLKKDHADAHNNLGYALMGKGQLDEAIAEYRKAIHLKKDDAEAHCNLGNALLQKDQFEEALVYLRRGHQLGSQNPHWPYPSAQWVWNCERLVELSSILPALMSGQKQPADPTEGLALAHLCVMPYKKRYVMAERFFREAFREEPKLADDLDAQHRYNAACAAVLASCGQGQDADKLDAKERTRLRQQALDWLRADLKAYRQLLEKSAGKAGPAVAQRMQHWLNDTDIAGVRETASLAQLPEGERKQWHKLWQEVETLRQLAAQPPKTTSSARP
jgi:Flp pilus assembly protein TadD